MDNALPVVPNLPSPKEGRNGWEIYRPWETPRGSRWSSSERSAME